LVTGGSRGIGRAIALRLAQDGARIGVNYLSHEAEAQQVVEQITQGGGEALALQGDVTQTNAVADIFRRIQEAWGSVEVLVNNAGIIRDSLLMRMSDDDWDAVVDVHLRASFLCTRQALREMVHNRWGRVINIGSVVGVAGNAGQANYAAAKAGVIGLTRSVAKEVANRNITVNYVAPGYMITDIVEELPQDLKDRILSRVPIGRFGRAEEVANLVGYLASDQASYITGQVLPIDGGMLISASY
jgi:3-oxoacyl-[acyl-carrier protein] reductase